MALLGRRRWIGWYLVVCVGLQTSLSVCRAEEGKGRGSGFVRKPTIYLDSGPLSASFEREFVHLGEKKDTVDQLSSEGNQHSKPIGAHRSAKEGGREEEKSSEKKTTQNEEIIAHHPPPKKQQKEGLVTQLNSWLSKPKTQKSEKQNIWHTNRQINCHERVALLIVNLGSPKKPTYSSVFAFLREFLSDKRIVRVNRLIWNPILYGYILPYRSGKTAQKYRDIWTEKGSPLVATTAIQADNLQKDFVAKYGECSAGVPRVVVDWAMRYGEPTISSRLEAFRLQGICRILIIPLFPHPAAATTGSIFDAVFSHLSSWNFMPDLRLTSGYAENPFFLHAIATSIQKFWQANGRAQKLIISFHGLPKQSLTDGDPYYCFCQKTARLVAERLDLQASEYEVAFQSRFGMAAWLEPYLETRLEALAKDNFQSVDIVTPGFASDCLETIHEIGIEYQQLFQNWTNNEGRLRRIPCLNDSAEGREFLLNFADDNLAGWTNWG